MMPLDEAVAMVLAGCTPLPPQRLPVDEALGCVLAEDVVATEAVPPFANSAMDGYAVRAADVASVPVELPVVAEVAAGRPADRAVGAGEAMRIFTGAPIPRGADAIVIVEHTERLDGGRRVVIHEPAVLDAHIRPAGDDVRPGDQVAAAGEVITPGRLGLLHSLGVAEVAVHPRPKVGVLSTGDELVDGTGPLRPGQIRDSNRPTLLALVSESGVAVPVDLGHAADDEDAITRALVGAVEECDVVLTTGGVSMGDTDLVKVVLRRLAGEPAALDPGTPTPDTGPGTAVAATPDLEPGTATPDLEPGAAVPGTAGVQPDQAMHWLQVAIKPAKPLAFGVLGARGVPVLGLPGNPVSSMVSFELFGRPVLRRRGGHPDDRLARARLSAVAKEALSRRADGKLHFVRVVAEVVDGMLQVSRSGLGQGSHQLSAMARANALALLPDGPGVDAGDRVQVILLDGPEGPVSPSDG